jgi:WD40 repeat protein
MARARVTTGEVKDRIVSPFCGSWNRFRLSPDGKTIAGGGVSWQDRLWVVDTATKEFRNGWVSHSQPIRNLNFSPDGKSMYTSCALGRHVLAWDTGTGRIRTRTLMSGLNTAATALSPDGKWIAVGTGTPSGQVERFMTDTGGLGFLEGPIGRCARISYSPDGRFLVGASAGAIQVTDTRGKNPSETRPVPGHRTPVFGFDRTGTKLATAAFDEMHLRVTDFATGQELWKFDLQGLEPKSGPLKTVWRIESLPDNSGFLTAGMDWQFRVWKWDKREHVQRFMGVDVQAVMDDPLRQTIHVPLGLAISPGGRWIAAGSRTGELVTFDRTTDPPTRKVLFQWKNGRTFPSVQFAADGRHLAAGTADGTILLFRLPPDGLK